MQTNTPVFSTVSQTTLMIRRGVFAGLPIMIGYLPIAITYGVLARQAGLSIFELTMMSVLVFAGASQFMAASLVAAGTGVLEIVIATFVLNFRHFVMSFSFMNRLRGTPLKWKLPLSFGLTDETFAVSSLHTKPAKEENGMLFYAAMIVVSYLSWVGGSFLGGVLGDVIPTSLSQSMGVALYAMFIGLLLPSVRAEWRIGIVALISMFLNFAFSEVMPAGWAIVCATIIGASTGIWLLKKEGESS
ncbi:branched-chain amino acid ABC transporter [Pontibacillus halophilus JSM 076056 = DSM 19796]|uniref:Branched-chain amino acid ABC transporter n=1 Tax=Pontibacillus halophilus JSM 076056 = DSM 19796 TaxID=1385510 RepID=A0A0A5I9R7_9BACI|nr:AzlC family ABC transporter permease [Pontibacillus halophilus]KGX92562.1 branched-chain amino acid ABC transporter [Pontibacillus halophilus JSM 076056 = DSM 19796]